jgi:hypothetical protein
MITNDPLCPNCKDDNLWRESADVGVGVIYGPYGCATCGYSEDETYNLASGLKTSADGSPVDQFGGVYPGWKVKPTMELDATPTLADPERVWNFLKELENDPNIQS